jgi:hypothetical protein
LLNRTIFAIRYNASPIMPINEELTAPLPPHTLLRSAFAAAFAVAIIAACAPSGDTAPTAYCSATSCAVALTGGDRLDLKLSPRPLKPMQPITARMQLTGTPAAEQVTLLINGTEMDMGFNRAVLRRQADGSYLGQFVLPVCVTGRMRWRIDAHPGNETAPLQARFLIDLPE